MDPYQLDADPDPLAKLVLKMRYEDDILTVTVWFSMQNPVVQAIGLVKKMDTENGENSKFLKTFCLHNDSNAPKNYLLCLVESYYLCAFSKKIMFW